MFRIFNLRNEPEIGFLVLMFLKNSRSRNEKVVEEVGGEGGIGSPLHLSDISLRTGADKQIYPTFQQLIASKQLTLPEQRALMMSQLHICREKQIILMDKYSL